MLVMCLCLIKEFTCCAFSVSGHDVVKVLATFWVFVIFKHRLGFLSWLGLLCVVLV